MHITSQHQADHEDAWELPPEPADWDEVVAEARRRGCTVADVLYDRPSRAAAGAAPALSGHR